MYSLTIKAMGLEHNIYHVFIIDNELFLYICFYTYIKLWYLEDY